MSLRDLRSNGIVVAEGPGSEGTIVRMPTAITAFVGRTLRGPVNRPVAVHSFAEFHNVFGGLWQPSTVSYAVEQFFENGGRRAVIVRVVNGGGPASITLPCSAGEALTLMAVSPGSRESLRASVDFDNIGANEPDRFNLVLQRVRSAGSEHIEDQEIFRRLSVTPGTPRYVSAALEESQLVRVKGPVPETRPELTYRAGARHPVVYVDSNPDGDDGAPLTDYDLIGSPRAGSGLFALAAVDDLHFVCIPPPTRDRDLGASVLLVAARLCRQRRAMLIVDPPAAWKSADDVLLGLREFDFRSDHALMCFPRIESHDRLRGRAETFANCGAVAGALARTDEQTSPWGSGPDEEILLRPGARPALTCTEAERHLLAAHGVNPLQSLRMASPRALPLRTLAGGTAASPEQGLLRPQRRLLLVMNSIECGTRWAVFGRPDATVWRQVERQVQAFLQSLPAAADGSGPSRGWQVVCDERVNRPDDVAAGRVNILVSTPSARAGREQSFMVTQSRDGGSVRLVRSQLLEEGTRMTVGDAGEAADDTVRQRTLAQELFGHYRVPAAQNSGTFPAGPPVTTAAGRLDPQAVARIHEDFGRTGQRL